MCMPEQDHLQLAADLAGVEIHPPSVEAFRARVCSEAAPYSSVEWIRRFPLVCRNDTGRLVMHAHVLNRALLRFFEYAVVGPTEPSLLNDPFDTVGIEVQFLRDDRKMSPHECEWHLQRFVCEQAEATERKEALRVWRPQLGMLVMPLVFVHLLTGQDILARRSATMRRNGPSGGTGAAVMPGGANVIPPPSGPSVEAVLESEMSHIVSVADGPEGGVRMGVEPTDGRVGYDDLLATLPFRDRADRLEE